jgi:hypothetical protein
MGLSDGRGRMRWTGAPTVCLCLAAAWGPAANLQAEVRPAEAMPTLHHAHLKSTDPQAAIARYRRVWPQGRAGTVAGHAAFLAGMPLLFDRVEEPPPGAWDGELRRTGAGVRGYSSRSVTEGSTAAARRAGSQLAKAATAARDAPTAAKVGRSTGSTP